MTADNKRLLNLGCGPDVRPSPWVNVDKRAYDGVDRVLDLEEAWPWGDGSVDGILASHVFEHLEDRDHFIREAHRVLRVGGVLEVHVPHGMHPNAYSDPTHTLGGLSASGFDRYVHPHDHVGDVGFNYGDTGFRLIRAQSRGRPGLLRRWWNLLAGDHAWNWPSEVRFTLAKGGGET